MLAYNIGVCNYLISVLDVNNVVLFCGLSMCLVSK